MADVLIHRDDVPLVSALFVVLVLAVLLVVMGGAWSVAVPRCAEDAVLIGFGSYDRGRWSRYECGPALDDFAFGYKEGKREDVNLDGRVDVLDVQRVVNVFLGVRSASLPVVLCVVESWDAAGVHVELTPVPCG